jgi:predicted small lipoprotein YifL
MLRESSPAVWHRCAALAACCALAMLCAGCGIKGPLKPPPGATLPPMQTPQGVEMPPPPSTERQ